MDRKACEVQQSEEVTPEAFRAHITHPADNGGMFFCWLMTLSAVQSHIMNYLRKNCPNYFVGSASLSFLYSFLYLAWHLPRDPRDLATRVLNCFRPQPGGFINPLRMFVNGARCLLKSRPLCRAKCSLQLILNRPVLAADILWRLDLSPERLAQDPDDNVSAVVCRFLNLHRHGDSFRYYSLLRHLFCAVSVTELKHVLRFRGRSPNGAVMDVSYVLNHPWVLINVNQDKAKRIHDSFCHHARQAECLAALPMDEATRRSEVSGVQFCRVCTTESKVFERDGIFHMYHVPGAEEVRRSRVPASVMCETCMLHLIRGLPQPAECPAPALPQVVPAFVPLADDPADDPAANDDAPANDAHPIAAAASASPSPPSPTSASPLN